MNVFFVGEPPGPLAGMLRGRERIVAVCPALLYRMRDGSPGLTLHAHGRVEGTLLRDVDPRLVHLLDRFAGVTEGVATRVSTDVLVGLRREEAVVHVVNEPARQGGVPIENGRWKRTIRRGRWS